MKEFEIHAEVSYMSGGTRYHNCYRDYVNANTAAEAKKIYKEQLKAEGIRLESADIIEA